MPKLSEQRAGLYALYMLSLIMHGACISICSCYNLQLTVKPKMCMCDSTDSKCHQETVKPASAWNTANGFVAMFWQPFKLARLPAIMFMHHASCWSLDRSRASHCFNSSLDSCFLYSSVFCASNSSLSVFRRLLVSCTEADHSLAES